MIFYSDKNVYEAAKDRLRFLFDEFYGRIPIIITISGGKDSTVCLHLAKEIMDERGIEKIPVFFLDQECEAPMVVEHIREIMHYDWVEPYWIQSYFQEWNASKGDWFNVWGPGEQWCREKEPEGESYKDVDMKVKHDFPSVITSTMRSLFPEGHVSIGGVRVEESPSRRVALTHGDVYKGITWGKGGVKNEYVFYPIWDWSCYDVWYYIFSNRLPYCKLYNYSMTKRPLHKCRVSSFIHENSIHNLRDLKEIDPDAYTMIMRRVENVNTTVHTYSKLYEYAMKVPPYFTDWDDYVLYLADHLIADPKKAEKVKKAYNSMMRRWRAKFGNFKPGVEYANNELGQATAGAIIAEDFDLSQVHNRTLALTIYHSKNYGKIKAANSAENSGEQ